MSVSRPSDEKVFSVALVGCGTVGGGTAQLLLQTGEELKKKTGLTIKLKAVVDKNLAHARSLGLPEDLLFTELDPVLADPDVDLVVELVGGLGFAKDLIAKALKAGKHVVSANKALLAHHGRELLGLARQNGVSIGFEASCGGGIPIIRALYDGLIANRIQALYGIVNGTCNFILSEMTQKKKSYEEALRDAQAAGFAEADPSLDVQGKDASHKIAILASLAFGAFVDLDEIRVKGIDTLDYQDVLAGMSLGYVIKLIAQARKTPEGIFVRVEPAFIADDHPLAWVSGSFNAVSVYGHAVGHTLYYGRGAGASPTASAVVSDVISIAEGSYPLLFKNLGIWWDNTPAAPLLKEDGIVRRYYIRLAVRDRPGTLAQISAVLGKHQISVASIHQPEVSENAALSASVPITIIIHPNTESTVLSAMEELQTLPDVNSKGVLIPILDEHPEF